MDNVLRITAVRIMVVLAALAAASPALAGDEAPQARAYFDWLGKQLTQVQTDMPAITAAAEAAARPLVGGKELGVRGGAGLNIELGTRSGGFMLYHGSPGKEGDVILYALGVAPAGRDGRDIKALLTTQIAEARKLKEAGFVVVGLASLEQLKSVKLDEEAAGACTSLLDNHAPAQDGLLNDRNKRPYAPTFTVANAVVAWTWQAELFAAITRLGKTPVMYKSYVVKGGKERAEQYKGVRFHEDVKGGPDMKVAPQAAGELGKAYLKGLGGVVKDVGTTSWGDLALAAAKSTQAVLGGGQVFVHAVGHYSPAHMAGELAADPGIFRRLSRDQKFVGKPDINDYVIVLGYCWPPGDELWSDPKDVLRSGGRGVAWVLAGFNTKQADLKRHELLIDQQWSEGDALVKVEGYDVRLFPPSGVITDAIEWAIEAQVVHDVQEHTSKMRPPPAPSGPLP